MKHFIRSLCIVLGLLLTSGCYPFGIGMTPPIAPLGDLLIDLSVYPPGWIQGSIQKNEFHTGEDLENMRISFRSSSSRENPSNHYIWRYPSPDVAQREIDAFMKHDLSIHPALVENKDVCKETFPTRLKAQRVVVRCDATLGYYPLYSVMVQYGAYISELTAYIDNHSMSAADFDRILSEIDKKMTQAAGN